MNTIILIVLLVKILLMLIILLCLKKLRRFLKLQNLNFDEARITECENIFRKGFVINWSREIFVIDSVRKTRAWKYKIKDSNGETMGNFYEK